MIFDTILDRTYRQLRNELITEELQEKADTYDNLMASTMQCPGCGETIAFVEDCDGGIQGDDSD